MIDIIHLTVDAVLSQYLIYFLIFILSKSYGSELINLISCLSLINYGKFIIQDVFYGYVSMYCNMYDEKNKIDICYSSHILGLLTNIFLTLIICIFSKSILLYLNLDPNIYNNAFRCIICLVYFQNIVQGINIILQFDEKYTKSNKLSIIYSILSCSITAILTFTTINNNLAYLSSIIVNAIIVVAIIIINFKPFKFNFNFVKSFKFAFANTMKNIMLVITNAKGIGNISLNSIYLDTVSKMNLGTKLTWKLQNAVATKNKIEISKNEFNLKRVLKRNLIGSLIVILTTIPFIALINKSWQFGGFLIFILSIELYDMSVSFFTSPIQEYINMQGYNKTSTFLRLSMVIIRLAVVVFINNEYALYIAVLISMTYHLIMSYTVYYFLFIHKKKI